MFIPNLKRSGSHKERLISIKTNLMHPNRPYDIVEFCTERMILKLKLCVGFWRFGNGRLLSTCLELSKCIIIDTLLGMSIKDIYRFKRRDDSFPRLDVKVMQLLEVLNPKVRLIQVPSEVRFQLRQPHSYSHPKQYAVNCQLTAPTSSKMALSRRAAFQTSRTLLRTTQRRSASHHAHDHHAEPVNESIGVRPTHHLASLPSLAWRIARKLTGKCATDRFLPSRRNHPHRLRRLLPLHPIQTRRRIMDYPEDSILRLLA